MRCCDYPVPRLECRSRSSPTEEPPSTRRRIPCRQRFRPKSYCAWSQFESEIPLAVAGGSVNRKTLRLFVRYLAPVSYHPPCSSDGFAEPPPIITAPIRSARTSWLASAYPVQCSGRGLHLEAWQKTPDHPPSWRGAGEQEAKSTWMTRETPKKDSPNKTRNFTVTTCQQGTHGSSLHTKIRSARVELHLDACGRTWDSSGAAYSSGSSAMRRFLPSKIACAGFAVGISYIFFIHLCDLLFDCGCRALWAGAATHCNIHAVAPPHCPWCVRSSVYGWLSLGLIATAQIGLAFRPGPLGKGRIAAVLLAFPTVGVVAGLVTGLVSGYWS